MQTDWRLEYDTESIEVVNAAVSSICWYGEISIMLWRGDSFIILIPLPKEVLGESIH